VQYGRQAWVRCWAQWPVTPVSSCLTSCRPPCCTAPTCGWRRGSGWMRDVLSKKSVEVEATRLLPSQPRASWRIGTSSEASLAGPRANQRTGNLSEALRGGASAQEGLGERAFGEAESHCNAGFGRVRESAETLWLSFGFDICEVLSNFFGSCLGYPFYGIRHTQR